MTTLLIMAGGTGGHVFPALAVAQDLRDRGVDVVWLGTRRGLEAKAVPEAGFDIEWVRVRGLRGKGLLAWLRLPWQLMIAMAQTVSVVFRRRPDALLGMGGFVAGPGGLVAWLLRRPLLIHEANAVAGFTNKLLSHIADRVLTGFPNVFSRHDGVEHVGNPVRLDIAALPAPDTRLAHRRGPPRILIVGGSQGAQIFNEVVPQALSELETKQSRQIWHQCGRDKLEITQSNYVSNDVDAKVSEFIQDMSQAYAWADIVICRSGAMTVAELSAAGVAAVLVPFPYAINNHQAMNAKFLVDSGAAIMLHEPELSPGSLAKVLSVLESDRPRILEMAIRARGLAQPHATRRVADVCLEVMHA